MTSLLWEIIHHRLYSFVLHQKYTQLSSTLLFLFVYIVVIQFRVFLSVPKKAGILLPAITLPIKVATKTRVDYVWISCTSVGIKIPLCNKVEIILTTTHLHHIVGGFVFLKIGAKVVQFVGTTKFWAKKIDFFSLLSSCNNFLINNLKQYRPLMCGVL